MRVDGLAAARTLLSYDGIRGGYCLFYVWQAYKAHGASTGRSAPTATEAWNRSDGRHPGDRNPPPGVPVFWGPKSSSNAGDVVISLGGGRVAATDYPYYGVTGVCTIDERERQIGRPYLGWAECIFDQPIALPNLAGDAGEPFEEDDMFSDADRALMQRIDADNQQIKAWLRGDQPDVDRLTEALPILRELYTRIRGANPDFDNVQDVQGQQYETRALLERILAALPAADTAG